MKYKVMKWCFSTDWWFRGYSSRYFSPLFHSFIPISLACSHIAAVESMDGSPALIRGLPDDALYICYMLQLEQRTPARCAAPWEPLASLLPTWGQMDLTPERINSGTFWLFSIPWRRVNSFLLSCSSSFFVTDHSSDGYVHIHFITSAGHRHRLLSAGCR